MKPTRRKKEEEKDIVCRETLMYEREVAGAALSQIGIILEKCYKQSSKYVQKGLNVIL